MRSQPFRLSRARGYGSLRSPGRPESTYEIPISPASPPSRFQMALWPSCGRAAAGRSRAQYEMTPCRFFQNTLSARTRRPASRRPCGHGRIHVRHHSAACRRFPSLGQSGKTAKIERLIQSRAWTDAALALIDLELPQWQIRRIAYDEGEWHCALSRERELPDWLDQSIESHHADLPLAILSAFVDAQRISAPSSRTSVPVVPARSERALRAALQRQFRVSAGEFVAR